MRKLILPLLITFFIVSCDVLEEVQKQFPMENGGLTESEIVAGLKQALNVGTTSAVDVLNIKGGFLNDPKVRIPLPPEAEKAAETLQDLGMGSLVNDFRESLNRAAEDAVVKAKPIFVDAIKSMTIADARNILFGNDHAATNYFKQKTQNKLFQAFRPDINNSLDKVNATKYWSNFANTYNRVSGKEKLEVDLAAYTTNKALDGLFLKVAEEEEQIRKDPAARVTEILRKVFAAQD